MYDSSIAPMSHSLKALAAILKKAEAYCEARKIDPNALLTARLFPDMLTLIRQVLIATDHAKGCGARLTGTANPSFPDEEKTFAELQARIAKTLDFLGSLKREQFADAANADGDHKGWRQGCGAYRCRLSFKRGAAQLLFPCDYGLQHPAPQRPRDWQGRFPGTEFKLVPNSWA